MREKLIVFANAIWAWGDYTRLSQEIKNVAETGTLDEVERLIRALKEEVSAL
jgi:hypothetical protein